MSIFGQSTNALTPTRPRTALSGYGQRRKPTATLNSAPGANTSPVQAPSAPEQGIKTGPTNPIPGGATTNPVIAGDPTMRGPMPRQPVGPPNVNPTIMPIGGIPSQAPQQIGSSPNEGINTSPAQLSPNMQWLNSIADRNEAGGNFYAPDSGGRAGWLARGGRPWQPGQPTGLEGVTAPNNSANNPILTATPNNGQIGSSPNEGVQRPNSTIMPFGGIPSQAPGINTGPTQQSVLHGPNQGLTMPADDTGYGPNSLLTQRPQGVYPMNGESNEAYMKRLNQFNATGFPR